MVDELTKITNIVFHTVKVPDEWKCGAIVKLQKKKETCVIVIIGEVSLF